jgi:hypothetical protein
MKKLNLTSGNLPHVFYSGGTLFVSCKLLKKLDTPINPYGVTPAFFSLGEELSPVWGSSYSSDYRTKNVPSDFNSGETNEPLNSLLEDMYALQQTIGLEDPKDSYSIEAWVHD